MRKLEVSIQTFLFVMGTLWAAIGCGDGEGKHAQLLKAKKTETAEQERLRRLQQVRAYNQSTGKWETFDLTTYDNGGVDFIYKFYQEFFYDVCKDTLENYNTDYHLAMARILIDFAEADAPKILTNKANGQRYQVLPPELPARVYLMTSARRHLRNAIALAFQGLGKGQTTTSSQEWRMWVATSCNGELMRDRMPRLIAQAADLYESVSRKAASLAARAGDDLAISAASPSEGAAWRFSHRELSRSAAAHILLGGAWPGWMGSVDTAPFCATGQLKPSARLALDYLRQGGQNPNQVLDNNIPTIELINGATNDSLKNRLAVVLSRPDLASSDSLAASLSLTDRDFEEARNYLKGEIPGLLRSRDKILEQNVAGQGWNRYAGTATRPEPVPSAAWATLGRGPSTVPDLLGTTMISEWRSPADEKPGAISDPSLSEIGYQLNLAMGEYIDRLKTWKIEAPAGYPGDDFVDTAMVAARATLDRQLQRIWGNVQVVGADVPGTGTFVTRVLQTEERFSRNWFWVVGDDGLKCAVNGQVDGASCDLNSYRPVLVGESVSYNDSCKGEGLSMAVTQTLRLQQLPHEPTRAYLIENQQGHNRALTGAYLPFNADATYWGPPTWIDVRPELEAEAAKFVALDAEWCGQTQYDCRGFRNDERMPLENDLSTDNDGVENSWRLYLASAKAAAEEARVRGKEYFDANLQFESRKESNWSRAHDAQLRAATALDEVQNICGSEIDARKILHYLGADAGEFTDRICGESEECIRRILEVAEIHSDDTDMSRLVECLSPTATRPFVSVGSKALCVWVDDDNPNSVCNGASASNPCPEAASNPESTVAATACAKVAIPSGIVAHHELVTGDDLLRYFEDTEPGTNALAQSAQDVCTAVRKLRTGGLQESDRDAQWRAIVDSGFFDPVNLKSFGGRGVGLRLRPRNNIEVIAGGERVWTTGDMQVTSDTSRTDWPCGSNRVPADCSTSSEGLFCKTYDCSNPVEREKVVQRLRGAVYMAGRGEISPGGADVRDVPVYDLQDYAESIGLNVGVMKNLCSYNSDEFPNGRAEGNVARTGQPGLNWYRCQFPHWALDLSKPADRPLISESVWTTWTTASGLGNHVWTWSAQEQPAAGGNQPFTIGIASKGLLRLDDTLWNPQGVDLRDLYKGLALTRNQRTRPESTLAYKLLNGIQAIDRSHKGACRSDLRSDCTLSTLAVVDAIELSCQLVANDASGCSFTQPPPVRSSEDLNAVPQYIRCLADKLHEKAQEVVVPRLPVRVRDALRKEGAMGAFPALGGDMGVAVSKLRGAMVELADIPAAIAFEVRQLAHAVEQINISNELVLNQGKQLDIEETIATYDTVMSAVTGAMSLNFAGAASMLARLDLTRQLTQLRQAQLGLEFDLKLTELESQISERARTLESYGTRLGSALETIDAQLSETEALRIRAGNKLAEAIRTAEYKAPNSDSIDYVYTWQAEETRRRYLDATEIAVRQAVLARRAIEERLGVRLNQLTAELPLVASPSTWVDEICRARGIDFAGIMASGGYSDVPKDNSAVFLGNYIGEYVGKLERTVESYRLAYPFSDGTDDALISVRDDLQHVSADCAVGSPNLLLATSSIAEGDTGGVGPSWKIVGCPQNANGVTNACIGVSRMPNVRVGGRRMPFYQLNFETNSPPNGYSGGLRSSAHLERGSYYVSILQASSDTVPLRVLVASNDTAVATTANVIPSGSTTTDTFATVTRIWRFEVDVAGTYDFTIEQEIPANAPGAIFGGVMLHAVAHEASLSWKGLMPWIESDPNGQISIPTCKDSSGSTFRSQGWVRRCMNLCAEGYSNVCTNQNTQQECFHELRFRLDDLLLERGLALQTAGFAKGNYNYRIDKVGVNFVGTGIRFCDTSQSPSSCMGNATVQYSLEHLGPFYARNYLGDDIQSRIFDGRIEHARGLAAERYLTNPLSSSDKTLFEPYLRNEFQGRPLSGEYVLRVWETPDVSFEEIEDVQLYLKYRYWTRLK